MTPKERTEQRCCVGHGGAHLGGMHQIHFEPSVTALACAAKAGRKRAEGKDRGRVLQSSGREMSSQASGIRKREMLMEQEKHSTAIDEFSGTSASRPSRAEVCNPTRALERY
jgi:hypothetical protein